MSRSVQIRVANPGDQAALYELVRAFPTPTPITPEMYAGLFAEKLADAQSFLAVAHRGTTLLGYLSGCRHAAFNAGGDTAWVDEVLVVEPERGGGIGRMLMQAFERWAAASDCRLVALATRGAADFYRQLGYESNAGYFKKYLESGQA